MVAPTPVSALLHAVAIVKAGVFTIVKVVVYVFGIEFLTETHASEWLMWVARLMSSSIIALTKDNLKARLAYSTISQLAYITLGASFATAAGIAGAGLHIAMHAVGKITLALVRFSLCYTKENQRNERHRQKNALHDGSIFVGSVCIIGLPPTGGAWSKWYLALGSLDAGHMILSWF